MPNSGAKRLMLLFPPFVIFHFNAIVSTFRGWSWCTRTTPHSWPVGFPHCCCYTDHSQHCQGVFLLVRLTAFVLYTLRSPFNSLFLTFVYCTQNKLLFLVFFQFALHPYYWYFKVLINQIRVYQKWIAMCMIVLYKYIPMYRGCRISCVGFPWVSALFCLISIRIRQF
jgi:hypothetical protein